MQTGSAGATGADGESGPAGLPGMTGARGMQGASGSIGPAGDRGGQGATGQPGFTGSIGERSGIRLAWLQVEKQRNWNARDKSTYGSVRYIVSPYIFKFNRVARCKPAQ